MTTLAAHGDRTEALPPTARCAADPAMSRGREFGEPGGGVRGPRSAFQRDRDRVIHSIAFRRMKHKAQVFVAPYGDHYRTRLTHSLEVAQVGRVIARSLGLDEDLTEALCLAHDIGHAPFGHAGEDALNAALADYGGFDHNAHTLRTLMRLESPYCTHEGLNLSWETLEGLAKHNGAVAEDKPLPWALAKLDRAFPLDLGRWSSLEAQVAAVADDIAYDNHDIEDGLRAGFISLDQLLAIDFIADQWRAIERRFPGTPRDRLQRELVRGQIGWMVNDVIAETKGRVADAGVTNAFEVRKAGRALAGFSRGVDAAERRLKRFMYDNVYYHPAQKRTAELAVDLVKWLHGAYADDPALLPDDWHASLPAEEPERARHIADFIAGMTDRYAIRQYTALFGPPPEELSNV
ncbi:deoxyguanosinetriphosphate triphosphohydrolase [Croceicoccus naphthovorans]|uniref:Deoxyguanosinetriphosphate triphosphohydrolase-like protein n=1 Tax=Croceicoccus naphthovorans TaxID=1348774 RepID=A0A0G3XIK8_9SPHN|nr:deoxyguanosinetriphosphate triphosphohydrolase [Croceicoccus naphthovorans]AKM10173.1 deoxyguanosinetriphosphate triphosphohydrolase [Croceicoccus naphthovorans]MBB3990594.1 dGTPase [Croceicoccus naphthovorans]